jgi:hypothetical protein
MSAPPFTAYVVVKNYVGHHTSYFVRSLLSEGRISYETVEKTVEGLRPKRIEREDPTGLITTTTDISLHPEKPRRKHEGKAKQKPSRRLRNCDGRLTGTLHA